MKLIVSFLLGYLYALAEIHKARRIFRIALFAASMLYVLEGCATPRPPQYASQPFPQMTIVNGGMNMDGIKEACTVEVEGDVTVLRACK